MPLLIQNSMTLGPLPSGSAGPSTLVEYLTSIGKDSWYGRYIASSGLAPNSDGTGGAVADGGAVGCWAPIEQVSFNQKFTQATAASRPAYGASRDGTPGVYGNASSWWMSLDSTTALNGTYTVLASIWTPAEAANVMSQSSTIHSLASAVNHTHVIRVANAVSGSTPQSRTASLSSTGNRTKIGWVVTGTGHNGNAMNIFRRSTGADYSSSTIFELAFVPELTAFEIDSALHFMA